MRFIYFLFAATFIIAATAFSAYYTLNEFLSIVMTTLKVSGWENLLVLRYIALMVITPFLTVYGGIYMLVLKWRELFPKKETTDDNNG